MTDQWICLGPCIDWEQCLDPLNRSICFNRTRCAKLLDCKCKNSCLIVWFDFVAVRKSIASICGAVFARFCSRNAFSSQCHSTCTHRNSWHLQRSPDIADFSLPLTPLTTGAFLLTSQCFVSKNDSSQQMHTFDVLDWYILRVVFFVVCAMEMQHIGLLIVCHEYIEDAKESPQPLDASTIADEQDSDPDDDTISVSSWQKLEVAVRTWFCLVGPLLGRAKKQTFMLNWRVPFMKCSRWQISWWSMLPNLIHLDMFWGIDMRCVCAWSFIGSSYHVCMFVCLHV